MVYIVRLTTATLYLLLDSDEFFFFLPLLPSSGNEWMYFLYDASMHWIPVIIYNLALRLS